MMSNMLMVNIKDTCLVDYDITTIAQGMYNIYIYMCMLCLADVTIAQRVTRSCDLTTNTLDDWLEPCPTSDNDVG